jgi:prevent-host-death family protein
MSSVGAFEAKTHFAQLLERAERGEAITITRRGRPVARLVPIGPGHDVVAARAAAGRLRALARDLRNAGVASFSWDEWKAYRDEGRY